MGKLIQELNGASTVSNLYFCSERFPARKYLILQTVPPLAFLFGKVEIFLPSQKYKMFHSSTTSQINLGVLIIEHFLVY